MSLDMYNIGVTQKYNSGTCSIIAARLAQLGYTATSSGGTVSVEIDGVTYTAEVIQAFVNVPMYLFVKSDTNEIFVSFDYQVQYPAYEAGKGWLFALVNVKNATGEALQIIETPNYSGNTGTREFYYHFNTNSLQNTESSFILWPAVYHGTNWLKSFMIGNTYLPRGTTVTFDSQSYVCVHGCLFMKV